MTRLLTAVLIIGMLAVFAHGEVPTDRKFSVKLIQSIKD